MNYQLVITVLSLGGSALIAFVTVRVTQKFYGEALLKAEKHIESHTTAIAKLEVEVDILKNNYVSKDEVKGLRSDIQHIEANISKLDTKIDKLIEVMINKK